MNSTEKLAQQLYQNHSVYLQSGVDKKYLPHSKLAELLQPYLHGKYLSGDVLGKSVQGRDIYCLQAGKGKIKLLFWSQMHGNESTATRALFDVFRFLECTVDNFQAERELILNKLDLCFVPMLNPDGSEQWQRETALGIDMNRDALRNVTPEGQLLQKLSEKYAPHYGFNLHDQDSYYTAGEKGCAATISLLAPPIDEAGSINTNRRQAMQVVCLHNRILQQYISNGVGKWKDGYEGRAYGEFFQRKGVATVLIESGGYPNDFERDMARKLNFMLILSAMYAIASGDIEREPVNDYYNIPVNCGKNCFDIIYRNATITENGHSFIADVGVRCEREILQNGTLTPVYTIEEIGDLSPVLAFNNIDCKGKALINTNGEPILPGKVAELIIGNKNSSE